MLETYPFFRVFVFDKDHEKYPEPALIANLRATSEEQAILLATFNYSRQNRVLSQLIDGRVYGKVSHEKDI